MEGRYEELGGYTVGFEHFREDADPSPLFRGLPDDRCQSPHWGYVIAGEVTSSTQTATRSTRRARRTTPRPGTSR